MDCRMKSNELQNLQEKLSVLAKEMMSVKKKTGIYIDSIQSLHLLTDTRTVTNILNLFQNLDNVVLFIPFHEELVKFQEIIKLESILLQYCTCFVHLYDDPSESDMACNLLLKKRGGKVIREKSLFKFGASEIQFFFETVDIKEIVKEKEVDFNTSMNFTLTEQQKTQRANVVLPYLEAQNDDGFIHYQPDEDDDYDDEDPDEDLDI